MWLNNFLFSRVPWEKVKIYGRSIRTFKATIGPSGGKKGYQGITGFIKRYKYTILVFINI